MKLEIKGDRLEIVPEGAEHIWAFKLGKISVPRAHVQRVETRLPPSTWTELRAPGTFVPGLIKAGTYYTNRGKEFWYVTRSRKDQPLTIELRDEPYRRLALTLDDHQGWESRINEWLRS